MRPPCRVYTVHWVRNVKRGNGRRGNLTGQERAASPSSTGYLKHALLLVCRADMSWRACVCACACVRGICA
eukprot:7385947-Pyramimonas_sp.AAC.1